LMNLAHSLANRFKRLGNLADIDDATAQAQAAVHLIPDGHPNKLGYLNNLGNSLMSRFERFGNLADLDGAIAQYQAALHLIPDGNPYKPTFCNNLGLCLQSRFRRLGTLADIDDAILQNRLAVHLTLDGHPDKPMYLSNLAISLQIRARQLGNLADINDAIAQIQAAVSLTPEGHPDKPGRLNNSGTSLHIRFEHLGDLDDINNAIVQYQAALNLTPDSHPDKAHRLTNFSNCLDMRFRVLNQPQDAEMAIHHLSVAAMNPVGRPSARFEAAERWIFMASILNHTSLLTAYKCALDLIPLVAWLGLSIVDRHQHLTKIGGIARDAAAAAISLEQYDQALEWLEQGRSVVWTQILHLRTPVDELREVNPDLADRLLRTSRSIEQGGVQGNIPEGTASSMEEQGRRYRALTLEWESIIEQVRSLPNFEDFLRPPSSRRLINAARNGPVVVLNIATERCDALAILPGLDDIIHIPLPNITPKRVVELRDELKDFLYSNGIRSRGHRAAIKVAEEADEQACERVLAELWNSLVHPVLSSLAFSVRLPLGNKAKIADSVISSLIRTCFPVFGGVPLDHWPSCRFMQLVYTTKHP
jgi:tetratricopeptide (TPR) repeat protein